MGEVPCGRWCRQPQSLAVTGIESVNIAGIVASESQARVVLRTPARPRLHFVAPSILRSDSQMASMTPLPQTEYPRRPNRKCRRRVGEVDRPTRVSGTMNSPVLDRNWGSGRCETARRSISRPSEPVLLAGFGIRRPSLSPQVQSLAISGVKRTLSSGPITEEVAVGDF